MCKNVHTNVGIKTAQTRFQPESHAYEYRIFFHTKFCLQRKIFLNNTKAFIILCMFKITHSMNNLTLTYILENLFLRNLRFKLKGGLL